MINTSIDCENIIQILSNQSQDLIDQYGIASLSIFGSYARGANHPDSDIDLLVEFERPVGLLKYIELKQHLERLLGRKVDLSTRRSLKTRMIKDIMREAIRVA